MSCVKYSLTNIGNSNINFNYQKCDDQLWMYQVDLFPNETKNIWLVDGTFQISQLYSQNLTIVNQGVFPFTPTPTRTPTSTPALTTTPTPTVTQTPTQTTTITPTPSITQTITPTNTITPTTTVTPTLTTTPTPSSFGTNNFKVTVSNSSRSINSNYTLTEIPYVGSSGIGFTATTGTFPLSATSQSSQTVYGTHNGVSGNVVFPISISSVNEINITVNVDDSFYTSTNTTPGTSGTTNVQVFVGATSGQTIEFIIS